MDKNDIRPQNSDEMELSQFFRWLGRGFERFGNSLLFALASIRNIFFNNKVFFACIILAGMGLGVFYSELLNKKYYKSTLVLSCDYLNNQVLANIIEKLNLLAHESEKDGLAKVLNVDTEVAKNIYGFEFEPFVSEDDIVEMEVLKTQLNNVIADKKEVVEKVITQLNIENKSAYEISVFVFDPNVVTQLERAFTDYLKNNEYIKRRLEITRINHVNRKQKLLKESRKLDSLKAVIYQNFQAMGNASRSGSNNVILGEDKLTDPLAVLDEDLELNQEILFIERQLYVNPDFELVDGFTTFKQPESASLGQILFNAFWISLICGYLIIGLWKFDRMLASYPTNK